MRFHSAVVLASLTTAAKLASPTSLSQTSLAGQDFPDSDFGWYLLYFGDALEYLDRSSVSARKQVHEDAKISLDEFAD